MHRDSSSKVLHRHGFVDPHEIGPLSDTFSFSHASRRGNSGRIKSASVLQLQASTVDVLTRHGEEKRLCSQLSLPATLGALTAPQKPYLRINEVLTLLPVSASTVWRWVRQGKLPAQKLGPRITVFSRTDLQALFSEVAK